MFVEMVLKLKLVQKKKIPKFIFLILCFLWLGISLDVYIVFYTIHILNWSSIDYSMLQVSLAI